MRKLLLFIALGFIMLSSCNNGKTKGADEEIDSIALRAKKDTILCFNGLSLGDTIVIKDTLELERGKHIELATGNRKIQVRYNLNGEYLNYPKPEYLVTGIYVDAELGDVKELQELLNLYISRYGKFSYYKQAYDTPITIFDDKVDSLSRSSFLTKFYKTPQGIFVWEWANCRIQFEITEYVSIMISYIGEGYNKRMEEEKQLREEVQSQDI